VKGVARMWKNLQHSHRVLPASLQERQLTKRSGQNMDVGRNAVAFQTAKELADFVHSMEDTFDGAARVDNMFAWNEAEAAAHFHCRTITLNVVWPAKLRDYWSFSRTYADLAAKSQGLWDDYQYTVPDDSTFSPSQWTTQALAARDHLQKLAMENTPLRVVLETQVLLQPHLDGRKATHLLRKVLQAETDKALCAGFRTHRIVDAGKPQEFVQKAALQIVQERLAEVLKTYVWFTLQSTIHIT
jgi:hypothetical protein